MSHDSIYGDYSQPDPPHQPLYLDRMVQRLKVASNVRSILDVGCGDENFTASLSEAGFQMYGIDTKRGGIEKAKTKYPEIRFAIASAYDDLLAPFARATPFDAVVAIEWRVAFFRGPALGPRKWRSGTITNEERLMAKSQGAHQPPDSAKVVIVRCPEGICHGFKTTAYRDGPPL
jgi:SAM-dependent methyltransferase